MIDQKYFRNGLEETAKRLAVRKFKLDVDAIKNLEASRKQLQVKAQELQNERNLSSKAIGQAKAKGEDVSVMMKKVANLGAELEVTEAQLTKILEQLHEIYAQVPNLLHASVPIGNGEEDNQEIHHWGQLPEFNFPVKDHVDLGEGLNLLDFSAAAKITGARFSVLRGRLAQLHRALTQFMLNTHINEHGYQEIYVPYIANSDSLFGTGQLPKFAEDQFAINSDAGYYLIATAEIPVTNLMRDAIIEDHELPKKLVAHTPCFRSEAGSYGKDTRGMIRQHQFEKVELVQFVRPEDSYQALEELTKHAETILQMLKLPYRRVALCSADIGFCSAKTYDLEVWLPGQNKYREISSCSNFEDFQARRMKARWRNPQTGKPELLHTLNGSALAVGRTLVAIMENYQDAQGNIHIPQVLQSYMNGISKI